MNITTMITIIIIIIITTSTNINSTINVIIIIIFFFFFFFFFFFLIINIIDIIIIITILSSSLISICRSVCFALGSIENSVQCLFYIFLNESVFVKGTKIDKNCSKLFKTGWSRGIISESL